MRIIYILLLLSLFGCKSYYQVFNTKPESEGFNKNDGFYVIQEKDFKILYDFWYNKGKISFEIFNNSGDPIIIDWGKSSFFTGGHKNNYWNETQYVTSSGSSGDVSVPLASSRGLVSNSGNRYITPMVANVGSYSTFSVIETPEKETIIPPNAIVSTVRVNIFPFSNFLFESDVKQNTVNLGGVSVPVYEDSFNIKNSPFTIRNYLVYKVGFDSNEWLIMDHTFYVDHVMEVEQKYYHGKQISSTDRYEYYYEYPYKKGCKFYIEVPTDKSVKYRNNKWVDDHYEDDMY